jgi:hypothetical protein
MSEKKITKCQLSSAPNTHTVLINFSKNTGGGGYAVVHLV